MIEKPVWVRSYDETEEALLFPEQIVIVVPITKSDNPRPLGSRVYFASGLMWDIKQTPRELFALIRPAKETVPGLG